MTSELYLHIGTHKTGTTAIQDALRDCESSLREEGVGPIDAPYAAELSNRDSADAALADDTGAYLRELIEDSPAIDRWIWSYEGFSGRMLEGYDNTRSVARMLGRAIDGIPTTIVVYLRRQDTFVESAYTQTIHQGYSWSFDDFLAGLSADAFDWQRLLDSYAEIFGKDNMVVRTYDKARLASSGGLIQEFAGLVGAATLRPANGEASNRGYDRRALAVARLANEYLDTLEKRALRKILQESSSKAVFGKYRYFSTSSRRRFLARYEESNRVVAKEYIDDSVERLFPVVDDDDSGDSSSGDELDIETATIVLVRALVEQKNREPRSIASLRKIENYLEQKLERFPSLKNWLRQFLS